MFERSLSALIKGLRSHRGKDEPKYVAQIMDEIRHEVRSGDMEVKAEAILKLTYLQMLGYPFANASFHMLEIMASPKFHLKHIGYLSSAQCFSPDTDVLILATNMIKKDLHSSNPLHVAVALNGLSHIVTSDLARHLGPDTIALLTHSRPMIRKKALLVLYTMIIKCPDLLQHAFERLREKVNDSDLGVVSAAVHVVCELARRDPQPFLPLSPQLFHLLTTSTNNWMLIKIIKLFGFLTPLEPRLVRKLVPPITTIISTTPAMSLLYECIHTIIIGGMLTAPEGDSLAETCVEKLARFLQDSDPNLKYIAFLALVKILPTHPHLVAEHQQTIFQSIEDPDLSIRLRALELVSGMASARNLQPILSQLMSHLEPSDGHPVVATGSKSSAAVSALKASLDAAATATAATTLESCGGYSPDLSPDSSFLASCPVSNNPTHSASYRLEIVRRILSLGSHNTYVNVANFEWYLDVLVRLSLVANLPEDQGIGCRIRDQIIDITSRVRAVRPHAIQAMINLVKDPRMATPGPMPSSVTFQEGRDMRVVLHAAAWVLGEYSSQVPDPPKVIPLLLQDSLFQHTDAITCASCVHNAVKLFAFWTASLSEEGNPLDSSILNHVESIRRQIVMALETVQNGCDNVEVQERTTEFLQLFMLLQRDLESYLKPKSVLPSHPSSPSPSSEETQPIDSALPSSTDELPLILKPPKSFNLFSPLFFHHTLGPVAEKAQSHVTLPDGLELDNWIIQPDSWALFDSLGFNHNSDVELDLYQPDVGDNETTRTMDRMEDDVQQRKQRLQRQLNDPFYIGTKMKPKSTLQQHEKDDVDTIPIVQLDLDSEPSIHSLPPPPPPILEKEEMPQPKKMIKKKKKLTSSDKRMEMVDDENDDGASTPTTVVKGKAKKKKKSNQVQVTIQ